MKIVASVVLNDTTAVTVLVDLLSNWV